MGNVRRLVSFDWTTKRNFPKPVNRVLSCVKHPKILLILSHLLWGIAVDISHTILSFLIICIGLYDFGMILYFWK
jgi:hypothetical protein